MTAFRTLLTLLSLLPLFAQAEMTIRGAGEKLTNNIRAHVTLANASCSVPAWRVQQYRRELPEQVQTAARALGYYATKIEQTFSQSEKCWSLELNVVPGPRITLRQINISLANTPEQIVPQVQQMVDKPTLRTGAKLLHSDYDSYKNTLIDTARRYGYWEAAYQVAELAIYPEEQVADVNLQLSTGPRFYFGELRFPTLVIDQSLMQRLAGDISGQPYSEDALQDLYKRFQGTEYFRKVVINPRVDAANADHWIPLEFDLGLAPRHSFTTGIGYSTDYQGARLRGSYTNRYFNGLGHHWRGDLLLSKAERELLGTYIIPKDNAAKEWYELSAGYVEEDNEAYRSDTLSTSARSIYALSDGWILNAGINLRDEHYEEDAGEVEERKTLVVPGIGATWINASEERRQQTGYRFETGITFSHQSWGSEVDFIQAYTRAKGIASVSRRGRFIARAEIAGTLIDELLELPPSVRFYTGGDNSVRGYGYNAIGVESEDGNVIGGGKLIVASIEYDHLIFKNWSLSAFTDIGDAFNENPNYRESWGMGVRWYSPVGPLRLDFAFPQNSEDDFRIHVSVGADL